MKNAPIFIVGVPRSGTTLLAAILGAHSRISCGPETHFFRKLTKINADKLLLPDTWPAAAIDFVYSIDHTSFSDNQRIPLIQKYQIDPEQIAEYLRRKEPSIPNILFSITEQYMAAMGKARWAEKTPEHILALPAIRMHFPESPIIRIIRDPRDVAISLTKVPWGAMSLLEALLLWKRMDDESNPFVQADHLTYSLRYEDLITSPEDELAKLCAFIGEEFEIEMLDTSETGKRLNARNVAWKDKVSQPIDAGNRSIWKNKLTRQEKYLSEAIVGGRLRTLGYPTEEGFVHLGEIFPSLSLATKYADAFETLTSKGIRFWQATEAERATVKVYIGDPTNESWVTGNKLLRIFGMVKILIDILKAQLSRQSIYWISGGEPMIWSGYSSQVLKKILSPYQFPPG